MLRCKSFLRLRIHKHANSFIRNYSTQPRFIPNYNVVVVDCESTGRSANMHRVIEVAAIKMINGVYIGSFSSLVNPGVKIPQEVQELTGINDRMVLESVSSFKIL